ncbi:hypothetical protein HK104_009931 [Borealophlyctis nickersoniae]|nr:hypothetical protein HK104_009931 [Borealophlyctis nickersoniae]
MILAALQIENTSPMDLRKACPLESIWTIDLAYLLRKYGVEDFTYYTSYIGVNWQYAAKQFYRDSISADRRRVHALFAAARDYNVRVIPLTLQLDDMRRFLLSEQYAVILLVDLGLLSCRVCGGAGTGWFFRGGWCGGCYGRKKRRKAVGAVLSGQQLKSLEAQVASTGINGRVGAGAGDGVGAKRGKGCSSRWSFCGLFSSCTSCGTPRGYEMVLSEDPSTGTSTSTAAMGGRGGGAGGSNTEDFVGHYILLVGYDPDRDLFLYRDPGTHAEICCVDADDLEEARASVGTDHDVIVAKIA